MDKQTTINEITELLGDYSTDDVVRGLGRMTEDAAISLLAGIRSIKNANSGGEITRAVLDAITESRQQNPDHPVQIAELATKLDLSVFQVNGAISILKAAEQIQTEKTMRFKGRQCIFLPDEDGETIVTGWRGIGAADREKAKAEKDAAKAKAKADREKVKAKAKAEKDAAKAKAKADRAKAKAEKDAAKAKAEKNSEE